MLHAASEPTRPPIIDRESDLDTELTEPVAFGRADDQSVAS